MSAKANTQTLLERNKYAAIATSEAFIADKGQREIATTHEPFPLFSQLSELGIPPPSVLIGQLLASTHGVSQRGFLDYNRRCCARLTEAIVIRNVCGHVKPNLNDILAIDRIFQFPELMVIHHTDCGALTFTDAQVRDTLRARQPADEAIDSMVFGSISDIAQSVKDDLADLRQSTLVRKELAENASGFIFDLKTGYLSKVEG